MGYVTTRNSLTSRGTFGLSAWTDVNLKHALGPMILGGNFISKLEVVSSLNTFNLGSFHFHYNGSAFVKKYNLKFYLGTVQTTSEGWNSEVNSGLKSEQKSGSYL